jgi:hypothetical protein
MNLTVQELTTAMHNAGFTQYDYATHCTIFFNGTIDMNEWPSDWGTPPSQAVIDSW